MTTSFTAPELQEDNDQTPTRSGGKPTFFDSLRKKLNQPPKLKAFDYIRVPGRGFSLKIDADLDADKLERLRSKYTDKKSGKLDTIAWFCSLIASQTMVFVSDDEDHEEAVDEYGDKYNFMHKDIQEDANAMDAPSCVETIFGRDANILTAGDQVLTICGYAGQGQDEDEDPFDLENA